MELNFKNENFRNYFEDYSSAIDKLSNAHKGESDDCPGDIVFSIVRGYFLSFCDYIEKAEEVFSGSPTLDLTYDTVKNLTSILWLQYNDYVVLNGGDAPRAISIAKKTLASYLMLLCMNEHGCLPDISKQDDFEEIIATPIASATRSDNTWCGMTIKVGIKEKIDLIKEVDNAVKITKRGNFRIRLSHVAEMYKRMCGVDLYKCGISDYETAEA